jgi:hypothetical protein
MLMVGRTCRAVGAALGVDEKTIRRWKQLPAFAREVDRMQRLLLVSTVSAKKRQTG